MTAAILDSKRSQTATVSFVKPAAKVAQSNCGAIHYEVNKDNVLSRW